VILSKLVGSLDFSLKNLCSEVAVVFKEHKHVRQSSNSNKPREKPLHLISLSCHLWAYELQIKTEVTCKRREFTARLFLSNTLHVFVFACSHTCVFPSSATTQTVWKTCIESWTPTQRHTNHRFPVSLPHMRILHL